MRRFSHLPLSFCVLGIFFCSSRAWKVNLPNNIKGLLGSCLYIPCSFDYYQYPPKRQDHIVWYQYHSTGYPVVHDSWNPNDVIRIFKGRTSLYSSMYNRRCSLKIQPVTWHHHRQKIYPWVDPDNVGRFTYRFFETTVTIDVVGRANEPDITVIGERKVGQTVTVQCSVYHTCYIDPPTLRLNIPHRDPHYSETDPISGVSRITLRVNLVIEREQQVVECVAIHTGGITSRATKTINAQCSFLPLTISPSSDDFLEGVEKKVTCTALNTCPQYIPTLTWNYADMPASTNSAQIPGKPLWRTVSTLTFTSSAKDHGKYLTCYAKFTGERTETSITLRVKRNMLYVDWSFASPQSLTGLKGSCIVIPCKFSYSKSPPSDLQVIWYLYQSNGYPSVYNQRERNVIRQFDGRTSLIGSVLEGNCSLKIDRLDISDNQNRLYPWIDKNPITSYHSQGHSFFDKTTKISVTDDAQEPQISIIDVPRVGEQSKVSCKVRHTCISAPPVLALNGVPGTDQLMDTLVSDGVWERTIERTWNVEEEHKSVECTVSYPSGQRAQSKRLLNVECPYEDVNMIQPPGESMTEGVAQSFICLVHYTCKTNRPSIVWNFPDMQSSVENKEISKNKYSSSSNLTFIGSLGDNGKSLTCTAKFSTGETSASSVLQIKEYKYTFDVSETREVHVLAADVPFRFSALTQSCVVIPCSFQGKEDEPMTRGIWSKKTGGIVFHNGRSHVLDHFKDRTKLLGNLHEGDCSLEIDDIKPFDNGPFCFYAQREQNEYRFNNSCVFIVMKASPDKPEMSPVPAEINVGSIETVSCSVSHTCSSRPPEFSWSVPNITSKVSDTLMSRGVWKRTSTITFMVAEGDGVKGLTCIATFWGEKKQANMVTVTVKGTLMYQFRSAAPVAIPVSLLLIVLAAALGVFFYRKRRSLWERLRQFTRRHPRGERDKPPRPEKPRSIWRRFSRATEDRVGWQKERRSFWNRFSRHQDNTDGVSVSYLNNATTVNCNIPVSKQRFPSPKRNQRRPPPATPQDFNIYGNI